MEGEFVIVRKCEHAVIKENGVVDCPYKQRKKGWIKENLYIKEKVSFPACPKRMALNGSCMTCVEYRFKRVGRRKVG